MSTPELPPSAIYRDEIVVPESAIDENGHVNNVVFVKWMQEVATRHFEAVVGRERARSSDATWVVRLHRVEYFSPAFAGDRIEVLTWVATVSRVRSLRRYKFLRASDRRLLVRGETDWVFVNIRTLRPCSISADIREAFTLVPDALEPQ